MPVSFQFHDALSAPDFERQGGKWDPHVHWILPTNDEIEADFVQRLLNKYCEHVEAYFIHPVFDNDTFSVELQFCDQEIGKRCHREYMRGFGKGGAVPKAKQARPNKAKKRLYKNRMYRLPDGEMFWYYALWDHHGSLMGKIYDGINDRLQNKIVHRSVLESAELIPKGEEPWVPVS